MTTLLLVVGSTLIILGDRDSESPVWWAGYCLLLMGTIGLIARLIP